MKDIDFDELDRAVSSVLGQKVADDATTQPSAEEKKPDSTANDASASKPIETPATAAEPSVTEPVKPSTTPLAVKRRGKFMDVMHPSSDMKPSPASSGSSKPRVAPVVTPLSSSEPTSTVEPSAEPTAALDESHSLIGAEPAPITDSLPDVTDETPTEEAGTADAQDTSSPESTTAVEDGSLVTEQVTETAAVSVEDAGHEQTVTAAAQATVETAVQEDTAADDSARVTPFLSDTQVEKRPLGAFGDTDGATTTTPDAPNTTSTPELQAAPAAALPRELQPDVVGVESVQATEAMETPNTPASPFAAKVPVSPEANDGRVEGHPLFDTSTYHEPIATVHHSSIPGWAKWLIGLAACLAVGAGVGYFLFTAGL